MTWQAIVDAWPLIVAGAAAGALAVILVVAALHPRRRRRPAGDLATVRSDVAELAGQLEDYARQIDRQVAERLDRLNALLAQSEHAQQELHRLLEAAAASQNISSARRRDGEVLALASSGVDNVEIARRLRMEVGEVELILNLHRSRAALRP